MAVEQEATRLQLRLVTRADLEEIILLDHRSFSSPWSRGMFLEELTGNHKYFYGAFQSTLPGKLLGFICFHLCLDEATLLRIAVADNCKRKGVASLLMRKMFTVLGEQGAKEIFLEVGTSNHAARSLYRLFGFGVAGRRPDYYAGIREDALLMKVRL